MNPQNEATLKATIEKLKTDLVINDKQYKALRNHAESKLEEYVQKKYPTFLFLTLFCLLCTSPLLFSIRFNFDLFSCMCSYKRANVEIARVRTSHEKEITAKCKDCAAAG